MKISKQNPAFWLIYMLTCGLIIGGGIVGICLCQDVPAPQGPPVVMEVMDPTLAPYAPAWQAEIERRFPHAVGILCHGGDFVEGQWLTSNRNFGHLTTAADVVRHFQQRFPDRTIVLLACNTGHLKLGIPGVYYAHSSVWRVPDRAWTGAAEDRITLDAASTRPAVYQPDADEIVQPKTRWEQQPEVVGNIFEFITD